MNIPEKIKIGSLNYTVEVTEHIKCGQDTYGEIFTNDLEIRLRPVALERQKFALVHEILHGILDNLGYVNQEEEYVHKLGAALYQLIVDNPDLFGNAIENK